MIAAQFTLGQLALIGWQLARRHLASEETAGATSIDLRTLNSGELHEYLSQLGA